MLNFLYIVLHEWLLIAISFVLFGGTFGWILYRQRQINILKTEQLNRKIRLLETEIISLKEKAGKQEKALQPQSKGLSGNPTPKTEYEHFRKETSNMIVHDLKNSLYSVISLSSGLADQERLEKIQAYAKKMLRLVLNILDLRKFEEASLQLLYSDVDLLLLIRQTIDELAVSLGAKSITVEISAPDTVFVRVDKELIKRVLENILVNAITHSGFQKQIQLNVQPQEESLLVEICNWGSFIPPEKQSGIFKPYNHATDTKTDIRSTGLGLAFCKMTINLHQGEIGVRSEPEGPCCFWFSLPAVIETGQKSGLSVVEIDFGANECLNDSCFGFKYPELLSLPTFDVYELSKILAVIKNFQPKEGTPEAIWKSAVEKAVYHCDNERYKELTALIKAPDGKKTNTDEIF